MLERERGGIVNVMGETNCACEPPTLKRDVIVDYPVLVTESVTVTKLDTFVVRLESHL